MLLARVRGLGAARYPYCACVGGFPCQRGKLGGGGGELTPDLLSVRLHPPALIWAYVCGPGRFYVSIQRVRSGQVFTLPGVS